MSNTIQAIFLISTIKEIENDRFDAFCKRLSIFLPSVMIKIPFYLFLDKEFDNDVLQKIKKSTETYKLTTFFSKIEIVNNNISDFNNVYFNSKDNSRNIPIFGSSCGPNFHFYKAINFKLKEYRCILLLETDCFFVKNYWLDKMNINIRNIPFWIYGSKYYGRTIMDKFMIKHINGVAVYNRCADFINFVDFVFFYIKTKILLRSENIINYDVAINEVIDIFNKRALLIDSEEILNLSINTDSEIKNYKAIKPNVILVHQKY